MLAQLPNRRTSPGVEGNGANEQREANMLWNLIVVAALVLLVLWVLGMALSWGGLIHILLVVALVLIVIRLLQGRKIA
jgi:hypothetical protein